MAEPEDKPVARSNSFRAVCVVAGGFAVLAGIFVGGLSDGSSGVENTTVVAAGSPEGEIYTQHGCPDQIIQLGNRVGPNVKHWNKYLVVYNIREHHRVFGILVDEGRHSNIAYMVENGKVVNGGYVGGGRGKATWLDRVGHDASEQDRQRAFFPNRSRRQAVRSHSLSSRSSYGTEVTETLAAGASEGEVIMKHGSPDNVVYLGEAHFNPTTGERIEVDKYLLEYRMTRSESSFGGLMNRTRSYNICYLIEGGRVMGGGYVGEGSSVSFFGDAPREVQAILLLGGLIVLALGILVAPGRRLPAAAVAALFTLLTLLLGYELPASLLVSLPLVFLTWRAAYLHGAALKTD